MQLHVLSKLDMKKKDERKDEMIGKWSNSARYCER
jgi:hypothetical protein